MTAAHQPGSAAATATRPSIVDLLTLREAGPDLFVADLRYDDGGFLYGGQVAAQALRAAAHTASRSLSSVSMW